MVAEFVLKLEAEGIISKCSPEQELKQSNYADIRHASKKPNTWKLPDLIIELAIPGEAKLLAVEFERTRK